MLSYSVNECVDCDSIKNAILAVDHRLAELGRRHYEHVVYRKQSVYSKRKIKDLTYYRFILQNLFWNNTYYGPDLPFKAIISKVKSIVA